MKIQVKRLHMERLLANSKEGEIIVVDTQEPSLSMIDKTGRVTGKVYADIRLWEPGNLTERGE